MQYCQMIKIHRMCERWPVLKMNVRKVGEIMNLGFDFQKIGYYRVHAPPTSANFNGTHKPCH